MYKLDRTAFKAFKAEDQNDYNYWKNTSIDDRLKAAYFLISIAYKFDPETPPKMDKKYFEAIKRE